MKTLIKVFIFLFLSVTQAQIFLPSGFTHGGELEFTSNELYEVESSRPMGLRGREEAAARLMAEIIQKKCAVYKCRAETVEGKWGHETRFIMPDSWWFQVSWDPLCVEIQTKPSTLQTLYKQQAKMEDLIFASAKEAGLDPREDRANHINTGIRSAFGKNNVRAFMNFFVDNSNHPELASGILRRNWKTAPPLTALGIDPTEKIIMIQNHIERGLITDFWRLSSYIERDIYVTHPDMKHYSKNRNQDLHLKNMRGLEYSETDLPFERRGSRAAKSFFQFILQAELQEAQIQWAKKQPGQIPFVYLPAESLTPAVSYQRFLAWLKEKNLNKERYLELVPSEFKNSCVIITSP